MLDQAEEQFVQNADVIVTEMEGELILLQAGSFRCFSTNAIGTTIWHALKEPSTVAEITTHLQKSFPDAPPNAVDEVTSYLDDLRRENLVVPRS